MPATFKIKRGFHLWKSRLNLRFPYQSIIITLSSIISYVKITHFFYSLLSLSPIGNLYSATNVRQTDEISIIYR